MRVAIVRDLDSTANSCFKGAPEPRYFAPCLEPYPAHCRSICYSSENPPPFTELPPTIAPQADILKAGAAGIEHPLKAKHALAGAGDDGCCYRAKLHLLDFDILGPLV
jgi:hypothetical protein